MKNRIATATAAAIAAMAACAIHAQTVDPKDTWNLAEIYPSLQAWNADTFGILKLTLHPTSYDWTFLPDAGSPGSFTDAGSADCH